MLMRKRFKQLKFKWSLNLALIASVLMVPILYKLWEEVYEQGKLELPVVDEYNVQFHMRLRGARSIIKIDRFNVVKGEWSKIEDYAAKEIYADRTLSFGDVEKCLQENLKYNAFVCFVFQCKGVKSFFRLPWCYYEKDFGKEYVEGMFDVSISMNDVGYTYLNQTYSEKGIREKLRRITLADPSLVNIKLTVAESVNYESFVQFVAMLKSEFSIEHIAVQLLNRQSDLAGQ